MDFKTIPLLPESNYRVFGSADKSLIIEGEWKNITNCSSDRWKQHIQEFFIKKQNSLPRFNYQYTTIVDELSQSHLNVYPIGLVSPRAPFYLIMSPKALNINPQVVLKTIKWKTEWQAKDYRTTDEYHLVISGFIQITARSERGLFYGLKTLEQLFYASDNCIPFQTIHDGPQLSLRAIHIDLKFFRPHQNFLLWQMRTLASFKINCVFIEWEDKYPFSGELAFIAHPAALTVSEKDELLKICSDHYLEAIPIIQSLGHYEYVLKHANWQHLREISKKSKKDYMMFCPSHPDTESAIMNIHNQIMAGMNEHAASHYIHLGLDECYYLGECPKCALALGSDLETGKSKMFIDWLNKMANHYIKLGKRPIVWHDMLVRHPQLIGNLDPQIIICDWEYEHPVPKQFPPIKNIDPTGQSVDWVRTWEQKTIEMIEKNPPITATFFLDKCWKYQNGKFPLTAFPYTKYFREHNFDVLCAPSTQFGNATPAGPRYAIHIPNIVFFNLNAIRNKSIGSLCTSWVVRDSPWPLVQFGFLLHAETCWSGKYISENDFALKFWLHFYQMKYNPELESLLSPLGEFYSISTIYGKSYYKLLAALNETTPEYYTKDEILSTYPLQIQNYQDLLNNIRKYANNNNDQFQFLETFSKYWQFIAKWLPVAYEIEKIAQSLDEFGSFGNRDIDQLNTLSNQLNSYRQSWLGLESELRSVFSIYIHPKEVMELIKHLITPISLHFDLFSQTFPPLIENIEHFIEKILDSMIYRNQ